MEVSLSLLPNKEAERILKFCVLYFDKVRVDEPMFNYYPSIEIAESFFPKSLTDMCRELMNAGVIYGDKRHLYVTLNNYLDSVINSVQTVIMENIELICENILTPEGDIIIGSGTPLREGKPREFYECSVTKDKYERFRESYNILFESFAPIYVVRYYETILLNNILNIAEGQNVFSNSKLLGLFLKEAVTKEKYMNLMGENKLNRLLMDGMELLLPDYTNLPFEAVLEIREKAKDELTELRVCIEGSLLELKPYIQDMNKTDMERQIRLRIQPMIESFNKKVKGIKWYAFNSIIDSLRNPLSYSPLFTSYFTGVPVEWSALATSGLIALESVLKYQNEKNRNINMDPLFFTVKLNCIANKYKAKSSQDKN